MHAVHRNELFGEGERHAIVVRRSGADDAGQGVVDGTVTNAWCYIRVETEDAFDERIGARQVRLKHAHFGLEVITRAALAEQAPPVGVHGALGDRIGDHRRSPFHGVDLGHQRRVDQPRAVVQPLVALRRVLLLELAGDGVMFEGEQLVQHAQPHPPVLIEAGDRLAAEQLVRQRAVGVDLEFAVDKRTHLVIDFLAAAIQLRTVPPVGVVVTVGLRLAGIGTAAAWVRLGTLDRHAAAAQYVAWRQRELDRIGIGIWAVVEPVVNHKLNPGGGDKVQAGGRLEFISCHQLVTDFTRVGAEQGGGFTLGHRRVDVTPEAPIHRTLGRVTENVAGTVFSTSRLAARITGDVGVVARVVFNIEEVVLEQRLAFNRQHQ